jgi:elongation of very long chain fatty acids protein 6
MLLAEEEANKKLVFVEHFFPNDSAFFFEKWTMGKEQAIGDFFADHRLAPFVACIIYGSGLYFGQKWMENRQPFQIRPQLVVWNLFLAIFSVAGCYRCLTDTLMVIQKYGYLATVCHPSGYSGITGFWAAMFVISKPLELVDTVFIVLRKQKLQTLHWYHHMTVLCYACYIYSIQMAVGRYFCTVNYTVHALMYTYFALRAARVRMPHFFALGITSLQIIQMVVGLVGIGYGLYVHHSGRYCRITTTSAVLGFLMYSSFFIMFLRLFLKKYITNDSDVFHGEGSAEIKKKGDGQEISSKNGFYTNGHSASHENGYHKKAE